MTDGIEDQTAQENGIISCQNALESAPPERDLVDIFFDYLVQGSRSLHAPESAPYFGTNGANILLNSLPTGTGKTHVTAHGSARFLGFLSTFYAQKVRTQGALSDGIGTIKTIVNGQMVEVSPSSERDLYENRSVLFISRTKNIFTPCHKIYGEILRGTDKAKLAVNCDISSGGRANDLGVPVLQLFSSADFRGDTFLRNTSLVGCSEHEPKEGEKGNQFFEELTLKSVIEHLLSERCVDFVFRHIEGGKKAAGSGQKGSETLLTSSRKNNFMKSRNEGLREYYRHSLSGFAASLRDQRAKTSEGADSFFKPPQNDIMMLCTYIAIAAEQSEGNAQAFLLALKNFGQDGVKRFIQNGRYVHDVGAESGRSDRISLIIKPELYLSLTRFISQNYEADLDSEQKLSRLFTAFMKTTAGEGILFDAPLGENEKTALTLCVYVAALLRLISPLTVALSQPSYIAATNQKIVYPSRFSLVGLVTDEGTGNVIMSEKTVKEDLLQLFGGYARKRDKETSHSAKTLMGRAAYHLSSAMHFQVTDVKRAQQDALRAREALQGALSHGAEQDKSVALVRACLPGLILLYDEADTGLTTSSNIGEKGWVSQTTEASIISKINIVDNFRLIFHPDFIRGFRKQRDIALSRASDGQDRDTDEDKVWEDEQDYRQVSLTDHVYYLGMAFYRQLRRKTCHFSSNLISIYDALCDIYGGKDAHSCARAMRLITVGDRSREGKTAIRQSFASVLFDFMAQSDAAKKKRDDLPLSPQMASCGSTLRFFENQHTERGQKPLINPEVFIFVDTVCGEPHASGLREKLKNAQENTAGARFMPLTEHVFNLTAVIMLFLISVGTFRDRLLKETKRRQDGDEDGVSLDAAIHRERDTQYATHQLANSLMSLKSTAEENAHLLGFIDAFCRASDVRPSDEAADCLDMQDCIEKLATLLPDSTICLTPLDTSGRPDNDTLMELRAYNEKSPVMQDGAQSYALSIECQPIDYALLLTAFVSNKRNLLVPMSATQNDDTIPYSLFSSRVYQNYAKFAFGEEVCSQPGLPNALRVIRTELAHAFLKTIEAHNECMGTFSVALPCEAGFKPPRMEENDPDRDYVAHYSRFIAELLFQKTEKKQQRTMQSAAMASLAGCFLSAQSNALIVCRSLNAIALTMSKLESMVGRTHEGRAKDKSPLKDILNERKVLAFYCPDDRKFPQGIGYVLAQERHVPSKFTFSLSQEDIAEQVADILERNDTVDDRTKHTKELRDHLAKQMTQMNKRCLFVLEIRNDQPCLTTLYFRPSAEDAKGVSLEKDYDIMRKKVCKYERAIVVACYAAIGVGFNGQISYKPYTQQDVLPYECDLTSIGFASLPYYNELFIKEGRSANIQNADKIQSKAQSFYNRTPYDQSAASCVFVNQSLRAIFQAAGRTTRKHTKSADLPDEAGYPLPKECYGHLHNVCADYFSYNSAPIQIGGSKGRGCVILTPFFGSNSNNSTTSFFLNTIYDEPITDAALYALRRIDDQRQAVIAAPQTMPEDPSSLWFGCAGSSTSALITALKEAGHSYWNLLNALDNDAVEELEEALGYINDGLARSNEAFQKIFNHGGYDEGHASKSYMHQYRDSYAKISEDKNSDLDTLKRQAHNVEHFASMNTAMRKIGVRAFEVGSRNTAYAELSDDQAYISTLIQTCHSLEENAVLNEEAIIEYMTALFRGRVIFPDQVPQADSIFIRERPLSAEYGEGITATMNRIWFLYDAVMTIASAPYRIVFRVFRGKGEEADVAHRNTMRFLHMKISQVYDPKVKDRVSLKLERQGIATEPAFALDVDLSSNTITIRPRPVHSFLFSDGQGAPNEVIVRNQFLHEQDDVPPTRRYATGEVCNTTYVRSSATRTACGRTAYQSTPPRQEDALPPDSLLATQQVLTREENLHDEAIIAIPFGNLVSTIKGNVGEAVMQKTLGDMLPHNEGWTPHTLHAGLSTQHTPDQARHDLMLKAARNAVYEKADYIFFAATQKRAVANPTNIFLDVKNMNSLQFFGEESNLARYAEKAYDLHKAAMRYQNMTASHQGRRSRVTIPSVYIIAQVVRSDQRGESLKSNQSIASALEEAIADHARSRGETCAQDIAVAVWSFHAPDYAHDKTTTRSERVLSLKMCSDYKNALRLLTECNVFSGEGAPEVIQPALLSGARTAIPLIQPIFHIDPIR